MMHFHPLANVLPMIEGPPYTELVADIRANGQHDPIITLDDQILDGRNRYLACLEAGIEPRFAPFTGSDPAAFVISKNLHRRHLNAGQRAMAVAKYATIVNGRPPKDETTGQPVVMKTVPEVAAMAGVNKATVSDARTIQAIGTLEEIGSVVNGSACITAVAKAVRARRNVKTKFKSPGYRIKPPEGKSVIDLGRDGIKIEEGGANATTAAKQIGVSVQTYVTLRDVLLLSQRDDLSRKDSEAVEHALHEISVERQVVNARAIIAPIALRVWGPRGARLGGADERRAKQFDDAVEFLKHTCENAVDMVIPHIAHGRAEAAIRQLSDAEASLRKLRERIREVKHAR